MPLKTWQCALAFALHGLTLAWCAFLLAPAQTEAGAGGWSHRTVLLVLAAVMNASIGVFAWAKPKRQIFFGSVVSSTVLVFLAAEIVWKCTYVHAAVKMAGALLSLVVLAIMRKMAARLVTFGSSKATQLTGAQKIFLLGLALNLVGYVIAPDWKVWAVIELVLWSGLVVEGWIHFIAFERTVKDTFGQPVPTAASQKPTSPQNIQLAINSKRVQSAKKMLVGIFACSSCFFTSWLAPGLPTVHFGQLTRCPLANARLALLVTCSAIEPHNLQLADF
jgi:hypothetical protein